MNTAAKQKASKKKCIVFILIAVVLLGIIIGALLLLNNPLSDNLKKAIGAKPSAPTFAFNKQAADGWWAADNYNSKENAAEDYKGSKPPEKLSVASRNIFQSRDTTVNSCFVMYAYFDFSDDIDAVEKKRVDDAKASSELIYTKLDSQTLAINTPEGEKSYELHEYAISGPASQQMQRGMSFGYVKLANGYITVDGICPEGNQLSDAVAGMKSISLVKA